MRTRTALLAAALLLAVGTQATAQPGELGVPDVSNVYQDDGGSGQDAADTCQEAIEEPKIELQLDGEHEHGELMPGIETVESTTTLGDIRDFWRLPIEGDAPGQALLEVETHTPIELFDPLRFDVTVTVLDPSCHPIAEEETHAPGNVEIPFPVERSGVYRVGLEIQEPSNLSGPLGASAAIPLAGHCSPMCFMYDMQAVDL